MIDAFSGLADLLGYPSGVDATQYHDDIVSSYSKQEGDLLNQFTKGPRRYVESQISLGAAGKVSLHQSKSKYLY